MFNLFIYNAWHLLPLQIRKILREALWKKLNLIWRLPSGMIIQIKCYADWLMYNEIHVDGEYDIAIKQAIKTKCLTRPLNFLDLGARVGFFSIRAIDQIFKIAKSDVDFKIILVEGSLISYKELLSRLGSSHFIDHLRIVHGLVGERNGYAEIYEYDYYPVNSVFYNNSIHKVKTRHKVRYIDLVSLYNDSDEIDLLKCDIEGSEQRFIENYKDILNRTKIAIFEFHGLRCDASRCINLPKEAGLVNHKQLRVEPAASTDMFWR